MAAVKLAIRTVVAVRRFRQPPRGTGLQWFLSSSSERDGLTMIASEPIVDSEPWQESPQNHLLTIDETFTAKLTPIPE
jgi:predicted glutamine amidotransferase